VSRPGLPGSSARLLVLLAPLAACSLPEIPCASQPAAQEQVYVVDDGWHIQLGLPADRLEGPLAVFRDTFPGARTILFGYGKRTFITAPARSLTEYLLGPIPGPAVIEVNAISVTPPEAYDPSDVIALALPPGGTHALADFIWSDMERDSTGSARLVTYKQSRGSLFYAAISGYSLAHTCNSWAALALHAAGLPISAEDAVFSGQVMSRAADAAISECRASLSRPG
jgi:hypothetical protein